MKKYLILSLLFCASAHARLWVNNKSQYFIEFVADTTVGPESIKVSSGEADFAKDLKFAFAFYKKYVVYWIKPDGSKQKVFEMNVNEGGNRKIVIKDNGSPESIYIASHDIEIRNSSAWGIWSGEAEDTGFRIF